MNRPLYAIPGQTSGPSRAAGTPDLPQTSPTQDSPAATAPRTVGEVLAQSQVEAVFVDVLTGETVRPSNLPGRAAVEALVAGAAGSR